MANRNKKQKKYTSAILTVIFLILFSGIIFAYVNWSSKNNDEIADMPAVSFSVNVDGKDKTQTFDAKFSFEGNVAAIRKLDREKYKQIVSDALGSVDYEKLTSEDGMEYAKEIVKEKILEWLANIGKNDVEIKEVYAESFMGKLYEFPEGTKKSNSNPNNPDSENIGDMFKR